MFTGGFKGGGTCPELGLTMFQERPSGAYRIQENFLVVGTKALDLAGRVCSALLGLLSFSPPPNPTKNKWLGPSQHNGLYPPMDMFTIRLDRHGSWPLYYL